MAALIRSGGGLVALAGLAAYASRRYFHDWGATKAECAADLPGDELVPGRAEVTTRAVTVEAPADEVWRWLVQIGQDRAGLYSYDWLENLAGLRIQSADDIHPEWQELAVGDAVRLVPPGWLGLADGLSMPVARIDPGRALVLRQAPGGPWDGVWSFHVHPLTATRCRLLSRGRTVHTHGPARAASEALDAVAAFMTRRMLLGIKVRAERAAARELLLTTSETARA